MVAEQHWPNSTPPPWTYLLRRERAVVAQHGEALGHEGEGVRVGDVPVEGVELGRGHGVQGALDGVDGHEAARRVQQDAAVLVGGRVPDAGHLRQQQLAARLILDDELVECLQAVASAERVVCLHSHSNLQNAHNIMEPLHNKVPCFLEPA